LAERASQKPDLRAKEHAARNDPMILEGLRPHMEHERGAFKVNYHTLVRFGLEAAPEMQFGGSPLECRTRETINAGNLAKTIYLLNKYAKCRLRIHFSSLTIGQYFAP
jgi:hypothetical protein